LQGEPQDVAGLGPPPSEASLRWANDMKITVNGKPMDLEAGMTVEGLLDLLGVPRRYTAVAVNRDITPKSEYGAV
jgi:thiamine biosynthesis protein ThiS